MGDLVSEATALRRFHTSLLTVFACVALLLAALGLYGLLAYAVRLRRAEIGIRFALGARVSDVVRLVLAQGVNLTLLGLSLGLAGAYLLTKFLASMLYGVSPADTLSLAIVSVLLMLVALLACSVPARRAAQVDPVVSLRAE
jgi:ABC-type antimicrobial peptide transport system permease subunit